jgi:hypothetical protein
MAFPTSPSDGQVTVQNGIQYTYAYATNSWTRSPASSSTLSVISDSFTGDGATVAFTLSNTPVSVDVVTAIVDGVPQLRGAFTLSSNILTFTGTPANGALIEIRAMQVAGLGVLTGLVYDNFTGNGSTVAYTLSTTPTNKNFTIVTVGGLVQNKVNYSVSGTTLTFTTAPPNTAPIEVITLGPAITTSTPNTLQNGTSSVNVLQNGNITISSAGTSNVVVVSNTGVTITGNASVTGNISVSNANLGNAATANYFAGTITTSSQPNITSVGTLANLTVSGMTSYGLSADIILTKTGATGVMVHDVSAGAVFYHTAPVANFTPNFTNVPVIEGRALMATLIISQGATPYITSGIQIDGVAQTIKWLNGLAAAGTTSKVDIVSFSLLRTGSSWLVFGQTGFYG